MQPSWHHDTHSEELFVMKIVQTIQFYCLAMCFNLIYLWCHIHSIPIHLLRDRSIGTNKSFRNGNGKNHQFSLVWINYIMPMTIIYYLLNSIKMKSSSFIFKNLYFKTKTYSKFKFVDIHPDKIHKFLVINRETFVPSFDNNYFYVNFHRSWKIWWKKNVIPTFTFRNLLIYQIFR